MKGKQLESCPFCGHHECFSIDTAQGLYHRFSCEAAGDVFTLLQSLNNLSQIESLQYAAKLANIELGERKPKEEKRLSVKERIYTAALEHFRATMAPEGSAGREWLCKTRGHSFAALERLKVGWSKADVLDHLKKLGFSEADIVKSGLARDANKEGEIVPAQDYF